MTFGCSVTPTAGPPQHIMVFDRPFLVMLERADARNPYFVLWVDNAELLCR